MLLTVFCAHPRVEVHLSSKIALQISGENTPVFRSKHKRRRVARAVGLHCDSQASSESALERNTTVDFIVPGEMELTTAVRSVSNATMARFAFSETFAYRVNHHVGYNILLTSNSLFRLPRSAQFWLGCCKSGIISLACRQYGGNLKQSQPNIVP